MVSNLPSSYSRPSASNPLPSSPPSFQPSPDSGPSSSFFIAILAIIIAAISLYVSLFAERPLSHAQKEALLGIANDLRNLQNREITLSAPVATTIELNRSYPVSDLFPPQFDIQLEFSIPVDTQLVGVSTTGAPVAFRVKDTVPIKAVIPISSQTAFANKSIQIQKTLPVEARFTSIVKVKTAYGTDLNKIIDKLESVAKAG